MTCFLELAVSLGTSPRSLSPGLGQGRPRQPTRPKAEPYHPSLKTRGRSVRWAPQTSRQGNVRLLHLVSWVLPGLPSSGHPGQATCPQYPREGTCVPPGTLRQSCVSRLRSRGKVTPSPSRQCSRAGLPARSDPRTWMSPSSDFRVGRLPPSDCRADCLPLQHSPPPPPTAMSL